MKNKTKYPENWTGLNDLARETGISKTSALRKFKILERDAPETHHRLVKTSNGKTLYKSPDTIALLRTDLRKNKLKTSIKNSELADLAINRVAHN